MTPKLDFLKEQCAGNQALFEKVLNVMKSEYAKDRQQYYVLLENKDLEGCAKMVHKLKGTMSMLGFEKGMNIAYEYEEQLRSHDLANTNLAEQYDKILTIIQQFLETTSV